MQVMFNGNVEYIEDLEQERDEAFWESNENPDDVIAGFMAESWDRLITDLKDDITDRFFNLCVNTHHNAKIPFIPLKGIVTAFDKAKKEAIDRLGSEEVVDDIINDSYDFWSGCACDVLYDRLVEELKDKFDHEYTIYSVGRSGATWIISDLNPYFGNYVNQDWENVPVNAMEVIEVQSYLNKIIKPCVNEGFDLFMADCLNQAVESEYETMLGTS